MKRDLRIRQEVSEIIFFLKVDLFEIGGVVSDAGLFPTWAIMEVHAQFWGDETTQEHFDSDVVVGIFSHKLWIVAKKGERRKRKGE